MSTTTNTGTASKKDLSYFMRESKEEIVIAPAPDTFKDKDGKPIQLEIKMLSIETIENINNRYRKRSVATDSKGRPFIGGGNTVLFKEERDFAKASRHILAEALVYPNLRDPALMDFYGCHDITEMPLKVFPSTAEYTAISKIVNNVLGYGEDDAKDEIDDAKN